MKIIAFILAITVYCFPFAAFCEEESGESTQCITAEKIVKPTRGWKMLKTEIRSQDKAMFVEINIHNPLNKSSPDSVDAKLILSVDPDMPSNVEKYNLIMAIFYNIRTNVVFKRIYTINQIIIKSKAKKIPIQTQCFARNVIQLIVPDEQINAKQNPPDSGVD